MFKALQQFLSFAALRVWLILQPGSGTGDAFIGIYSTVVWSFVYNCAFHILPGLCYLLATLGFLIGLLVVMYH